MNIVNRFLELEPVRDAIAMNENKALCSAIRMNQQDIFYRLLEFPAVKDQVYNINLGSVIKDIWGAGCTLNLAIFDYLLSYDTIRTNLKNTITNRNLVLSLDGLNCYKQLALLERILMYPEFIDIATRTKSWGLQYAAENGRLTFINRMLNSPYAETIVCHQGYEALIEATRNGHIHIVNRLLVVPYILNNVSKDDNEIFRCSVKNEQYHIVNRLLNITAVFAYVESHSHHAGAQNAEYKTLIRPFIAEKLLELHRRKIAFEENSPHEIFNLDANEAIFCFYIIRHMARQNPRYSADYSGDDIRFLLEIPAVKLLAHTEVTPRMPNELIRLALTSENQDAAGILLELCPEVRIIAERNQFYRLEAQGHFDLAVIAQDRESSMRALSTGEVKRLDAVIKRYQPIIKETSVESLFKSLQAQLIERYQKNPAKIKMNYWHDISLPSSWQEFKKLGLTSDQSNIALKAYYKNKDHTALRYLSKPNYWMAPNAGYVEHDAQNPHLVWSTFESYKPLIVMLWLAANDVEIKPTDGFTLKTRVDQFFDELAYLGRAHNWDESRVKINQLDSSVTEEFDDGEGDKPSCFSGVKRRLFQSVQGYPLLKIVTLDVIQQELRDFVREQFKTKITEDNRSALREAWDKFCNQGTPHPLLNDLNITEESQTEFIDCLEKKYPTQLKDAPEFKQYIIDNFCITHIYQTHVERFAGLTNLQALLEPQICETEESSSPEGLVLPEINAQTPCYNLLFKIAFISSIVSILSAVIAILALIGILNLGTALTATVVCFSITTAGLALYGFFNEPTQANQAATISQDVLPECL